VLEYQFDVENAGIDGGGKVLLVSGGLVKGRADALAQLGSEMLPSRAFAE